MNRSPRPRLAFQALRELGPRVLALYAVYRLELATGYLRWRTPSLHDPWTATPDQPTTLRRVPWTLQSPLPRPARADLLQTLGASADDLLAQADEVTSGQVRLFGGPSRPLQLAPEGPLAHWTAYASGRRPWGALDVKLVWEPGRFGWACLLARAYHLSRQERYAAAFWSWTEQFLDANPPNQGPHWASAQEVALRLIALTFALPLLGQAPQSTPDRQARLAWSLAAHAARLPATLTYARAQNNNHLLTESLGLYTAGVMLPDHPSARHWRSLGWDWLNRGLQTQIATDGTYMQHSTNYHRLVLQTGLWAAALAQATGQLLPEPTRQRLARATRWALDLLDDSGRTPNLGPNDGALILPLSASPFADFRPTLAAAAQVFLGERRFSPGAYDELADWLFPSSALEPPKPRSSPQHAHRPGPRSDRGPTPSGPPTPGGPLILRNPASQSWAYLRVARFHDRPGHADQLHLDLWWRSLNVAADPGTYRYNGPQPWVNPLIHTQFHNTVTVDERDQMTFAGRFLWLDWAQGELLAWEPSPAGLRSLVACHHGYRRLGLRHRRTVSASMDGTWQVEDELLPEKAGGSKEPISRRSRLHWLLPDWPWALDTHGEQISLLLDSPFGRVGLVVSATTLGRPVTSNLRVQLVRAGELLHGQGPVPPARGWISPTYDLKEPALSWSLTLESPLPAGFITHWEFPAVREAS